MSGRSIALAAERHCRQLSHTIEAIRLLKIQITDMLEPVKTALMRTEFTPFQKVSSRMAEGIPAVQAWMEICSANGEHEVNCLNESEKSLIRQLFDRLGTGGRAGQVELLSSCCIMLESALSNAQIRAKEVAKLYTSLGFLTGVSVAILVV